MSWATWDGTPAGTPVQLFDNALYSCFDVCRLSDTLALAVYEDATGGTNAVALTVSGNSVSIGTPLAFNADGVDGELSVCALSATTALVCYKNAVDTYGYACVLTVSGTTVTAGTPTAFFSAATLYISVCALSASAALVCFQDGTDFRYAHGKACVLSVSGTTVTAGTPAMFQSGDPTAVSEIAVTALDSSKAVVCFRHSYGTACLLSVSGSTVTPETPVAWNSDSNTLDIDCCALSTTTVLVVAYATANTRPVACVLSISGTTLTAGTQAQMQDEYAIRESVCKLSATEALLLYRNATPAGRACVLTVSGSSVSSGTAVTYSAIDAFPSATCLMTSDAVLALYKDQDTNDGWAEVFFAGALLAQEGFRFVNDDGDEDASTFAAGQDTNVYMAAGGAGRLRILLDAAGDVDAAQYQLEFRYKAPAGSFGAWGKVKSVVTDGGVVVTDDGATVYD